MQNAHHRKNRCTSDLIIKTLIQREALMSDFLLFQRYFFKVLTGDDFQINWHHILFSQICTDIYNGKLQNVVINVPPGSSKSLSMSVMFPLWCFAKNPHCRFLCTSFSDTLVDKNSIQIRDVLKSKQWQRYFPGYTFKQDTNSKKEWIVNYNDEYAGEYTAASLGGQITGRRAGFLNVSGFSGAIIVDDPLKPADAWSDASRDAVNRLFPDTLRSRKGNSRVPIIVIMQRLHSEDCTDFLVTKKGMGDSFENIVIPAKIDRDFLNSLSGEVQTAAQLYFDEMEEKYTAKGLFCGYVPYWDSKEPMEELDRIEESSSYTFAAQYMQEPTPAGGSVFKRESWIMEDFIPSDFDYVKIIGDTAMKTGKHNDYSVLLAYGMKDNEMYILNIKRGKWEAPELFQITHSFYSAAKDRFGDKLKSIYIEDKASGTGLIQALKKETRFPIIAVQREKDKLSRAEAALVYVDAGRVHVPKRMPWTDAFLAEMSQFTRNDTHAHDDIVDCLVTAVEIEFIRPSKASIKSLRLY